LHSESSISQRQEAILLKSNIGLALSLSIHDQPTSNRLTGFYEAVNQHDGELVLVDIFSPRLANNNPAYVFFDRSHVVLGFHFYTGFAATMPRFPKGDVLGPGERLARKFTLSLPVHFETPHCPFPNLPHISRMYNSISVNVGFTVMGELQCPLIKLPNGNIALDYEDYLDTQRIASSNSIQCNPFEVENLPKELVFLPRAANQVPGLS